MLSFHVGRPLSLYKLWTNPLRCESERERDRGVVYSRKSQQWLCAFSLNFKSWYVILSGCSQWVASVLLSYQAFSSLRLCTAVRTAESLPSLQAKNLSQQTTLCSRLLLTHIFSYLLGEDNPFPSFLLFLFIFLLFSISTASYGPCTHYCCILVQSYSDFCLCKQNSKSKPVHLHNRVSSIITR